MPMKNVPRPCVPDETNYTMGSGEVEWEIGQKLGKNGPENAGFAGKSQEIDGFKNACKINEKAPSCLIGRGFSVNSGAEGGI